MEKYNLASDACDYRLIRINNCLQCFALICDILALIDNSFRQCANIIDMIADCFFHCLSGCMTAQVAHEMNYQIANGTANGPATASEYVAPPYAQK